MGEPKQASSASTPGFGFQSAPPVVSKILPTSKYLPSGEKQSWSKSPPDKSQAQSCAKTEGKGIFGTSVAKGKLKRQQSSNDHSSSAVSKDAEVILVPGDGDTTIK